MNRSLLDFISAGRLHAELETALHAREFVLHLQPQVDLVTGRIAGAEALIRWNHLDRGLLLPSEFVPFAQDRGLLPSIGAWVIGEAAAIAAGLRAIDPTFRLWFNVSATELGDPGWCERITGFGVSLDGLGAEITESVATRDLPEALCALEALKQAGLSIALAGFGTRDSSFAHLTQLLVDVVKLDRSFVAGLPGEVNDREMVERILRIGRRLGFETIAEGIETVEQERALREAGCRYGQGFYLGGPMPVEGLITLVHDRRRLAS